MTIVRILLYVYRPYGKIDGENIYMPIGLMEKLMAKNICNTPTFVCSLELANYSFVGYNIKEKKHHNNVVFSAVRAS